MVNHTQTLFIRVGIAVLVVLMVGPILLETSLFREPDSLSALGGVTPDELDPFNVGRRTPAATQEHDDDDDDNNHISTRGTNVSSRNVGEGSEQHSCNSGNIVPVCHENDLDCMAKAASVGFNNTVIVMAVGRGFVLGSLNWFGFARAHGIHQHVIVVALDDFTYKYFQSRGAHVVSFTSKRDQSARGPREFRKVVWIRRTELIVELLRKGYNVVHTDVDALWLQNPMPRLWDSNADIVFSRADPGVLCMGFVYYRGGESSGATSLLSAAVDVMVQEETNDQNAVNSLMRKGSDVNLRQALEEMQLDAVEGMYNQKHKFVVLEPTYTLRHGGQWAWHVDPRLFDVAIFHPSASGFDVPFWSIQRPLYKGESGARFVSLAELSMRDKCHTPSWAERTTMEPFIPVFQCMGLWIAAAKMPLNHCGLDFDAFLKTTAPRVTDWQKLTLPMYEVKRPKRLTRPSLVPAQPSLESPDVSSCNQGLDLDCTVRAITAHQGLNDPKTVIIMFMLKPDTGLAINWLAAAHRIGVLPMVLILTDQDHELFSLLVDRKAAVVSLQAASESLKLKVSGKQLTSVGVMSTALHILEQGTRVLLFDAQAQLLSNPLKALEKISRGTDAVFARSSVGNVGSELQLFTAHSSSVAFVKSAIARMVQKNFQISTAVNILLREGGVDTRFQLHDGLWDPLKGSDKITGMKWAALPHTMFFQNGGHWIKHAPVSSFQLLGFQPAVSTCGMLPIGLLPTYFAPGSEDGWISVEKLCGVAPKMPGPSSVDYWKCLKLWLLADNYRQIPPQSTFSKWLQSVTIKELSQEPAEPNKTTKPLHLPAEAPVVKCNSQSDCLIQRAARNNTVIVTSVTFGFTKGLANWASLLQRLGLADQILCLAFDEKSYEVLSERGVPTVKLEEFKREGTEHLNKVVARRHHVWKGRTVFLKKLLAKGLNVLFSDVDALFFRDPLQMLHGTPGDIVFSSGRPGEICLGFSFYRPTTNTMAFLDKAIERMEERDENDQESVNKLLGMKYSNLKEGIFKEMYTDTRKGIEFSVLPQRKVLRYAGDWTDSVAMDIYVFHPNAQGWDVSMKAFPRVHGSQQESSKTLRQLCKAPGWAERMNMADEAEMYQCLGFWVIIEEPFKVPKSASMSTWLHSIALSTEAALKRRLVTVPALVKNDGKCLASFLIIGTRKGGTTSLYQYIAQHPKVKGVRLRRGAQAGELFYSWRPQEGLHWADNVRNAYNQLFLQTFEREKTVFDPKQFITGESTVVYNTDCLVPRAVKEACGTEMKMIMLVREPVARLKSLFNMRIRLGSKGYGPQSNITEQLTRELDEFIRMEKQAKSEWFNLSPPACLTNHPPPMNGIWESLYVVHLRRWLHYFPRSQIKVVLSEDLFKNPAQVLREAMSFLDLSVDGFNVEEVTKQVYNSKSKAQAAGDVPPQHVLSQQVADRMNRLVFQKFNKMLAEEFNLDLSSWAHN